MRHLSLVLNILENPNLFNVYTAEKIGGLTVICMLFKLI